MQKSLSRPGARRCLIGSGLALIAFFLPYSGLMSLWDVLLSPIRPEVADGDSTIKVALALQLLLLLSVVVSAHLTVFSRPGKWNMPPGHQVLSSVALGCNLFIAFFDLIFLWVGEAIAGGPFDVLAVAITDIGIWLIPVGLILSLIGGIRLERARTRLSP